MSQIRLDGFEDTFWIGCYAPAFGGGFVLGLRGLEGLQQNKRLNPEPDGTFGFSVGSHPRCSPVAFLSVFGRVTSGGRGRKNYRVALVVSGIGGQDGVYWGKVESGMVDTLGLKAPMPEYHDDW